MEPLGLQNSIYTFEIAGKALYTHLIERANMVVPNEKLGLIVDDPRLLVDNKTLNFLSQFGDLAMPPECTPEDLQVAPCFPLLDGGQIPLQYPWHLLNVLDEILSNMTPRLASDVTIEDGVEIEGNVTAESGTHIYSGAKLKGNIYLGADSMIGSNALVRGNVSLGPRSGVGFSSEVKNVLGLENTKIGPMAVIKDSLIEENCMFAGTSRISNYRLDEQEIDVMVAGEKVGTGRRQFGAIVGAGTTIGAECLILPGRKIGPNSLVGPLVIVVRNIPAGKRVELQQELRVSDL